MAKENLMNQAHKGTNTAYRRGYDEIRWRGERKHDSKREQRENGRENKIQN